MQVSVEAKPVQVLFQPVALVTLSLPVVVPEPVQWVLEQAQPAQVLEQQEPVLVPYVLEVVQPVQEPVLVP